MQDRIEKQIELKAPIDRVWRALSDHREFGEWFGVNLDGPFVVGEVCVGHMTIPGYENLTWRSEVKAMEPPNFFSYTWHPYSIDPDYDYSSDPQTLVEFTLEPVADGTRLTIVESGFAALPKSRYPDALQRNDGGWSVQIGNIQSHVEA